MSHALEMDIADFSVFAPTPATARASKIAAASVNLHGHRCAFTFTWNPKYKRYAMDIIRDGEHLKRAYPEVGQVYYVHNLLTSRPTMPDAAVIITDETGNQEPLTPSNLGNTHKIVVIHGVLG